MTSYAVTATLSLEAFQARSTSDVLDDVTWRFFGVDGGIESAAAAGVEATTETTSRSARIAVAINTRLRTARFPLIVTEPYSGLLRSREPRG
jgi:hypothetical protein